MQKIDAIHKGKLRRGLILAALFLMLAAAGIWLLLKYYPFGGNSEHSGTILVQANAGKEWVS